MTEILFYHLERQPLEQVLPTLIERTLQRGWRAVVQFGSEERLDAVDALLWTYREDSFLPHGRQRDGHGDRQPVFLTTTDETPNGARIRFLVDGAEAGSLEGYERIVCLFDGRDPELVGQARNLWKRAKAEGLAATYWQQTDAGRWEKRA